MLTFGEQGCRANGGLHFQGLEKTLRRVIRKVSNGSKAQLLYFHGSGEKNQVTIGFAEKLISNLNLTVRLMDSPGNGKSSGHIHSQAQLEKVVDAFVEQVKSKSNNAIYAFGFSMGTYFANCATGTYDLDALILTAPYIKAKEQITDFVRCF